MAVVEVLLALPITSLLAGAGYVLLVAALLHPALGDWLKARLVMPAPSSQRHLGALDAFRGLAALYVATFHTWQWSQPVFNHTTALAPFIKSGHTAVPFFVALSGFLIYRAASKIETRPDFRAYLYNRILRVFPLYVVCVLAALALGQFRSGLPLYQTLTSELFMLRALGASDFIIPPAWSLYVEVLFYLIVPVFVVAAGDRALLVASIAFVLFCVADPIGPRELMLWKYFCVGIITSEAHRRLDRRIPESVAIAMFVVGAGMLIAEAGFNQDIVQTAFSKIASPDGVDQPPASYSVGLGVAAGLVMLGATHSAIVTRILAAAPWRVLGAVSYSIFMWHAFIVSADLPIAFDGKGFTSVTGPLTMEAPWWALPLLKLPAVLFVSVISFLLVERPFLRLKSHFPTMSPVRPQMLTRPSPDLRAAIGGEDALARLPDGP